MKKVVEVLGRLDRAGQETFIMNIFRNIDPQKYKLIFSVNTKYIGAYEDEVLSRGGEIYHNPYPANIKYLNFYLKEFRKFLRENGPFDVVHCHTYFFGGFIMWAAYKEGVPVRIMHSHSTTDGYDNTLYRKCYRQIARFLIHKYATDFAACGKDAYVALFQQNPPSTDKILNNAIDLDLFAKDAMFIRDYRKQFEINKSATVFISVARFNYVKNHHKIISVFKTYLNEIEENAILLLVGEGELKKEIEDEVKEYKIEKNVRFLGSRSDVDRLLQISDVFIMPSRWEGLPVSLVEAQAAGVRCVVSDVITDEIDMGLDLIYTCSLDCDSYMWVNICKQAADASRPDELTRKKALSEHGYSIEAVLKKLEKIYG